MQGCVYPERERERGGGETDRQREREFTRAANVVVNLLHSDILLQTESTCSQKQT